MPTSSAVRSQIESALAKKIPSALTPPTKMIRPVATTGIVSLDEVLAGGLPLGAVSELVGPECSGRTTLALSFLACRTQAGTVCAWIDVSDTFDPLSAASVGLDLARLLWVRCGVLRKTIEPAIHKFILPEKYNVSQAKKGLHGGGTGPHPRSEGKGLSQAVTAFLGSASNGPRYAEPRPSARPAMDALKPCLQRASTNTPPPLLSKKPWSRMEQALRATDLLIQSGGFSAIVLDMGSLPAEVVSLVPLATWYRYRAAAERTQSSILLLTQHPCAKSSADLVLRFQTAIPLCDERTIFSGIAPSVEVVRRRFTETQRNVTPLRKPPQSVHTVSWQSRTVWAGCR
jgi:hypothetical protein